MNDRDYCDFIDSQFSDAEWCQIWQDDEDAYHHAHADELDTPFLEKI